MTGCQVLQGDCRQVLEGFADATFDAVVTDPPYDLTAGKKGGTGPATLNPDSPAGRSRIGTGGFMGATWDATGVAFDPATWTGILRVLKPGGHLLAFGGTRTYHRMACAIEDADFEIRDSLHWIYGNGFPKSLDVSKAIDSTELFGESNTRNLKRTNTARPGEGRSRKSTVNNGIMGGGQGEKITKDESLTEHARQWEGWGTALRPSHEPIVLARRPLTGTVAANVLEYGTGALNVDGCRTGGSGGARRGPEDLGEHQANNQCYGEGLDLSNAAPRIEGLGRWPANVLLSQEAAAELDGQSGYSSEKRRVVARSGKRQMDGWGLSDSSQGLMHADSGGASRFFPVFRYQAKAPSAQRPRLEDGTVHVTVKPLDLMRWLVRLVTPPGGLVLDPFAGSGTTGSAALDEGMRCVLIEREETYCALIRQRLDVMRQPTLWDPE